MRNHQNSPTITYSVSPTLSPTAKTARRCAEAAINVASTRAEPKKIVIPLAADSQTGVRVVPGGGVPKDASPKKTQVPKNAKIKPIARQPKESALF